MAAKRLTAVSLLMPRCSRLSSLPPAGNRSTAAWTAAAVASARIIVTGSGSVAVPPDYAEIASGVTSQAKTAKDASDDNAKVTAALNVAGDGWHAADDIQTLRFSVSPFTARSRRTVCRSSSASRFPMNLASGPPDRQGRRDSRFADPSRRDRFRQRAVLALQHVASARSSADGGAGGCAAQGRALCSECRPSSSAAWRGLRRELQTAARQCRWRRVYAAAA